MGLKKRNKKATFFSKYFNKPDKTQRLCWPTIKFIIEYGYFDMPALSKIIFLQGQHIKIKLNGRALKKKDCGLA